MEKVSIIIPVYNVEKYLPKCLESVLGQTYADLEIICVDDGTPDRSAAAICGNRDSSTMNFQTSFSGSFPHRISHTAEAGICTDPNHKLAAHNAKSNRTRTTISRCSCCLFGLSFIRITVDSSGIDSRGTGRGGTMQRVPVTTGRDETESLRSSCIGTSHNRISFSPGRL